MHSQLQVLDMALTIGIMDSEPALVWQSRGTKDALLSVARACDFPYSIAALFKLLLKNCLPLSQDQSMQPMDLFTPNKFE